MVMILLPCFVVEFYFFPRKFLFSTTMIFFHFVFFCQFYAAIIQVEEKVNFDDFQFTKRGKAHHTIFSRPRATNEVTTHHFSFRPYFFIWVFCLMTLFFKFRQRHVFQFDKSKRYLSQIQQERKIFVHHLFFVQTTPFFCLDHTFFVQTTHFSVVFLFYSLIATFR